MDGKAGTWFSQMQKKWRNTHFYSDLILDRGKDNGKTRTVALGKDRILKSESEDWKIFQKQGSHFYSFDMWYDEHHELYAQNLFQPPF